MNYFKKNWFKKIKTFCMFFRYVKIIVRHYTFVVSGNCADVIFQTKELCINMKNRGGGQICF